MKSNNFKVRAIAGRYDVQGSRLIGKDFDLLIQQRAAHLQTQSKSGSYMLAISKPMGFRNYVSSLWPTKEPGRYEFDVAKVRYSLHVTPSTAVIELAPARVKKQAR